VEDELGSRGSPKRRPSLTFGFLSDVPSIILPIIILLTRTLESHVCKTMKGNMMRELPCRSGMQDATIRS
jgi:hypothetical protein